MLFNSVAFGVFLGSVAVAYHLCPLSWRRWYLLITSYAFYCTWSVPFACLLLAVTAVAVTLAIRIEDAASDARRRVLLTAGVAVLFLPLVVFKYCGPLRPALVESVGPGWASRLAWIGVAVPVGVSYYTLKLVSYLVDVYWGRVRASRRFSELATFAAFFPQILSGPIQRAGDFVGQVACIRPTNPELIASGLRLILFGLFEKLVVADRLGVFVEQVYGHPLDHSGVALALATYVFAVQLYADFSGLTDIAIGAGRVLGITAPPNFDAPFYAENIQEFWRRWHMTLTGWVRDYLFTPLRMTLRDWGQAGLVISLMVNMVAVGVWHAASLTFIVFGLIHGTFLFISSLTLRQRERFYRSHPALRSLHSVVGPIVTFNMVVATLVLFRAESLGAAWYAFRQSCSGVLSLALSVATPGRLVTLPADLRVSWSLRDVLVACGAVVVMEMVHILHRQGQLSTIIVRTPAWARWGAYYALALAILIWAHTDSPQFIYAEF